MNPSTVNPKQWFWMPLEWLQGWQFHQVYYFQYLRRIARPGGHFCHSNGPGTRRAPLSWTEPETGAPRGLRRSQMYTARAFLVDQGIVKLYPSKFGTVGKLNFAALEKFQALAVRADVLNSITSPASWIATRLQILRAYFEHKAEKERGHTAPAGRRPCLGVREFKARLSIVPHWRYLAPALHAPAAPRALFPEWQALALEKACTMPDSKPAEIAPDGGNTVYNAGHRDYRNSESTIQYQDLPAADQPPKVWKVPAPVLRHLRSEWQTLCHENQVNPAALAGSLGVVMVAANIEHRRLGGGAMARYSHALSQAAGALYFVQEVADRSTKESLLARILDQMRRYNMGAYFEKWKADEFLREDLRNRAQVEAGRTADSDAAFADFMAALEGKSAF